ncbi:MAG: triose-phosphate isomerase [bacterium]
MIKATIVANWKMNATLSDSLVISGSVYKNTRNYKNIDIVLAPPSIFIYPVLEHLHIKRKNFHLACQNIYFADEGEFTGEISAKMIKGLCDYVVLGHSERREHFGETDEMVNKKIESALKSGITPIVCIGESEKFHLEDHFDYEVKRMSSSGGILDSVSKCLSGISELEKVIVVYEPIWAIGSDNAASGAYCSSVCYIIKSHLERKFGDQAEKIKILYGGSTTSENTEEFMRQPNIDGLLVGGSSLNAREFSKICKITSEVKGG